ncbi:MAG: helix-turn-helix domain-containing protein [Terracidiphilus sp.]
MQRCDTKELAVEIALRFRAFRESKGLTQRELAAAISSRLRGIQDNEGGKSAPGAPVLRGLADLGANINWLLTGRGPMLSADLLPTGLDSDTIKSLAAERLCFIMEAASGELARRIRATAQNVPIRK